jgi:hypothetical protein
MEWRPWESIGGASPGFPVEIVGVGEHHAAFLNESRTREHGWSRVQEIRVAPSFSAHVRCGERGAPVQGSRVVLHLGRQRRELLKPQISTLRSVEKHFQERSAELQIPTRHAGTGRLRSL